ncbi:MAG: hypothetical protein JO141_22770 [Bradyrhizobium sp.]|nr:hypothetical protein [Bradyrhizobium sp.]
MNKLFVGFSEQVGETGDPAGRLFGGQGLYIAAEVPEIRGARIFDPAIQSFNPLAGMDNKRRERLPMFSRRSRRRERTR